MKKVALFSFLLVLGMVGSRLLPDLMGDVYGQARSGMELLTMIGLAFIMIHVGYECEIDKSNPRQYGWDFVVAMTAAAFPWIFAALYFVFVMFPPDVWASWPAWLEALLAGKSAAPTSTGVLFAMLAAAGLSATWLFQKARVLAVLVNFGKMFPVLCYRRQASWKQRLALAISLWPRAEVGAGVLILSLGYGIGGPMVKVAMLCLALNLVLTGAFIWAVKRLVTNP
ncbi:MAG: hypothetical protein HQ582_05430 [Planctomycetes bacterium]|nr:hypothetical protein [Planctomycetota bacterium]